MTDSQTQQRRDAATAAFKQRAHDLWHKANGKDAPCHMCGNIPTGQKGFAL